ncbi:MAG: hypothetical protein HOW73_47655 [Polyangiaceae bacterium]|nr:hypothetical protein [Polyangiaceae bacterium]
MSKPIARLTLDGDGIKTEAERAQVAAWLESQAQALRTDPTAVYAKVYRASFERISRRARRKAA